MRDKVKEIIENTCNITIEDFDSSLEDNGVDSLSMLDVTLKIEDSFNIVLSDYIVSNKMTLNSLISYINEVQNLV
jgi:acyl carrier protein